MPESTAPSDLALRRLVHELNTPVGVCAMATSMLPAQIDAILAELDAASLHKAMAQLEEWRETVALLQSSLQLSVQILTRSTSPAASVCTLPLIDLAATLQAVPGVGKKLAGQFAGEERVAAMGERAATTAKAAGGEAKAAAGAKARVDKAMAQAEVDYVHGSKQKAYESYVAALRQSMADIDPAKYKAAIGLIERAGTLQQKTDKARALAKKFLWGAAAVGAGYEAKGVLQ